MSIVGDRWRFIECAKCGAVGDYSTYEFVGMGAYICFDCVIERDMAIFLKGLRGDKDE